MSVLTEPEAFAAEQQGDAGALYDSHEELRAELDAAKERIIAIEGHGIPWDSVSTEYDYTGELVAKKIAAAKERIAKLVAVVERVEWRGQLHLGRSCPDCLFLAKEDHAADCALKAALEGE